MDTVTQIALGAAVGEVVLGKKIGNKAVLWGAVAGTIPDLDVLATPFVSDMQQLAIHRGLSHSLTFAVFFAPLFGAIIARIYRNSETTWKKWAWLGFWGFITHIILDCFTSYGTQVFQPFSDYPVILGSIFIIDPLYTIPLIGGIVGILFLQRDSSSRRFINYTTLGLSTLYLLFTFAVKLHVNTAFENSLKDRKIAHQRLFSTPTPLNSLLWMGIAEQEDRLWVGLYSLLDDGARIKFRQLGKNRYYIADMIDQPPLQRLLWFSRGYYTVTEEEGQLYFNDLRFGRSDTWLTDSGSYVFVFKLVPALNNPKRIVNIERIPPRFNINANTFYQLFLRIFGNKTYSNIHIDNQSTR